MSKTVTKAVYDAAKAKADAGDIHGAWQVLADAGDNYARAGARIMDPNGDSFIKAMVEKTWEFSVGLDVYNAKFTEVAANHFTVRLADEIFVIEKGSVVERGAHDELLAGDGCYARLHNAQSQPSPSQPLCLPA